eukprot:823620_1
MGGREVLQSKEKSAATCIQTNIRGFLGRRRFRQLLSDTEQYDSPYVPTSDVAIEEFLNISKITDSDTVCDLGCGDARVLVAACQKYVCNAIGVEIDESKYARACENVKGAGLEERIVLLHEDFRSDIVKNMLRNKVTVVFLFMLPEVLREIASLLCSTLRDGTRVVSFAFDMDTNSNDTSQLKHMDTVLIDSLPRGLNKLFVYSIKLQS